jgi:hypothetical protein
MDLMVHVRGGVMVFHWAFRLCGPIGQLVTASWYVGAASTMAIKIAGGSLRRPPPIFHYYCLAAERSCSCSISVSCLSMIFAVLWR